MYEKTMERYDTGEEKSTLKILIPSTHSIVRSFRE